MEEDAKIRFLFNKVQHTALQADIAALKARITTSAPGTNVTYITCANHLSTAVSQLPEYVAKNRVVSALTTGNTGSLYNADGTFNHKYISDYIPEWKELGQDVRTKIIKERKRLNIKFTRSGGNGGDRKGGKGDKQLNKLKQQNRKFKRKIKALSKKVSFEEADDDDEKRGRRCSRSVWRKSRKNEKVEEQGLTP